MTCSTVAGAGVNHKVVIKVAGQLSAAWPATLPGTGVCKGGLCFQPPTLTSISAPGNGVVAASTTGGEVVVITGRFFGPIGTVPDYVFYGHAGTSPTQYAGQSCSVTTATATVSQLTCQTAPGVGAVLTWSLSIGLQVAKNSGAPLTSSYAAPQVFAFSGVGAVDAFTTGSQAVVITVSWRRQEPRPKRVSPAKGLPCSPHLPLLFPPHPSLSLSLP